MIDVVSHMFIVDHGKIFMQSPNTEEDGGKSKNIYIDLILKIFLFLVFT